MTCNTQRLHCAVEIDILLGEISNEENFPNARADDLTVHASNYSYVNRYPPESYLRDTI